MANSTKQLRLFPRWSLRNLLIVVAILSFTSWRVGIANRYETTVASIRDAGGYVYFREQLPRFETKSTITVNVNGNSIEKDFYDAFGDYVLVVNNGKSERKSVRYTPRTGITAETAMKHPSRSVTAWLLRDSLDEIAMIYLPIESCSDPMVARLAKLKNLDGLLLAAPATKQADALDRLAELVEKLPELEISTSAPDFRWKHYH